MKAVKKIFIVILIILVIYSGLSYIDYFIVKTKNKTPIIALKEESNQFYVYKSFFYKVWKCKSDGSIIIGDNNDPDAICNIKYEYDKKGYYTNSNGVRISREDLMMLTLTGLYTSDMVENFKNRNEVTDALYVVENLEKLKYKNVLDDKNKKILSKDGYEIVVFPEFVLDDDTDSYTWMYKDDAIQYCKKDDNIFAEYKNNKCGKFKLFSLDKKWCELYKTSTLSSTENNYDEICKNK